MRSALMLVVVLGCGCGKSREEQKPPTMAEMRSEAAVEWAQKELPDLDKKLASSDPGAASSTCAVIKVDLRMIEKADAELATSIKQRCLHDLPVRELTVAVDKAEAARKADPTGFISECSRVEVDLKELAKSKLDADPVVAALVPRISAACPKK